VGVASQRRWFSTVLTVSRAAQTKVTGGFSHTSPLVSAFTVQTAKRKILLTTALIDRSDSSFPRKAADPKLQRTPAAMKPSPSVLCVGILPLAGLSIIAAVIFLMHEGDTSVPGFWLSMFLVGSPLTIFLTGVLVHVRWRDRTPFQKVDCLAIASGSIAALIFIGILLSLYLRTRRLERELPRGHVATRSL
jgi:hypothetical protein